MSVKRIFRLLPHSARGFARTIARLVAISPLLTGNVALFADTLMLRNSGIISGDLVPVKNEKNPIVRTFDGIVLQLPSESVSRSIQQDSKEVAYRSSLLNRPDTAEAHREIASECKERHQLALSLAHTERVVELDPKDNTAWALLNYHYDERSGEWIPRELLNKRLGLVVYEGRRMTMHAAELSRAKKQIKEDDARFKKELERAFRYMGDDNKTGQAARQYLSELRDPRANPMLASLLIAEVRNRRDGTFLLEMLLKMPRGSATQEFIKIARQIDVPHISDTVLNTLRSDERTRTTAMLAFVSDLNPPPGKKPNIEYINRAGRNLEVVGDERILPTLIGRLQTVVVTAVQIQGGAGIDKSTGGMSHSTGGVQQRTDVVNQTGVLNALTAITGESFGFDQAAWRQWYALTYATTNVDTRRFD